MTPVGAKPRAAHQCHLCALLQSAPYLLVLAGTWALLSGLNGAIQPGFAELCFCTSRGLSLSWAGPACVGLHPVLLCRYKSVPQRLVVGTPGSAKLILGLTHKHIIIAK